MIILLLNYIKMFVSPVVSSCIQKNSYLFNSRSIQPFIRNISKTLTTLHQNQGMTTPQQNQGLHRFDFPKVKTKTTLSLKHRHGDYNFIRCHSALNLVRTSLTCQIPKLFQRCLIQDSSLAEMSSSSLLYHRMLGSLPDGIQMAFAYGSGVFRQEGHRDLSQNMLDFIIIVDDPATWHLRNLKINRHHYSFMKYFGSRAITHLQEKYGAGIYFNTLVPFEDRLIKYGVISTDRLITDLLDWDTLYVSGRLHKPVKLLVLPRRQELVAAMQVNLQSAVHAALLLMPENFCEEALYITIAGLSYSGDFRMSIGEDHNKVTNIVRPNVEHFRKLYQHTLEKEDHIIWHKGQGRLEQFPNHTSQFHHLHLLPKTVLLLLQQSHSQAGKNPDLEEVLRVYANDSRCDDAVAKCIAQIVWKSSWSQSLKTILSSGIGKSLVYSSKKLAKMFQGRKMKQKELLKNKQ